MGRLPAGTVILAQFPFSDLSSKKVRPCIVLAEAEFNDYVVCQITSSAYKSKRAVQISTSDFDTGSIIRKSYARPDKIVTLDQSMIYRELGVLNRAKYGEIKQKINEILQL